MSRKCFDRGCASLLWNHCKGKSFFLTYPVSTKHLNNICTMLDQRRRRWVDIVQMFYKCFLGYFAVFFFKWLIVLLNGITYIEDNFVCVCKKIEAMRHQICYNKIVILFYKNIDLRLFLAITLCVSRLHFHPIVNPKCNRV